jgi:tetratricopeptide (TPR) repeat protein
MTTLALALRAEPRSDESRYWFERAASVYARELAAEDLGHLREYAELLLGGGGDAALALSLARRDFEEVRQDLGAHVTLAWALYVNGEFKQAADQIDRALLIDGRDPTLQARAGVIFAADSRLAEAKVHLERALSGSAPLDAALRRAARDATTATQAALSRRQVTPISHRPGSWPRPPSRPRRGEDEAHLRP